ncbi:DUF817 domain-containing protein [Roseovarius sp. SCSIO 43702]|uniref:DUF817 domain-containing protein n=1 Tax=Roseovarius sp. SCSIO 43702 TaxID=2823043 RepID=UPI001C7381EC|nr:DUF817 domain-containing protein [Roseovarius sp. SCSIO 43702]QYX56370.1 DUF817 domain-containing protein [Roseovarius sp. SCSIO 43702]
MTKRPAHTPTTTRRLERALGDRMRACLPGWVAELVMFVLKMGWSALFGISLLFAIILTKAIWQGGWTVHRYDALVLIAVGLQVLFLALKLETWAEARVILLFHATGTAMEIFKVHAGSWAYPEAGLLKFFGVPLFSGFMYASVGSFMARTIRVFDMRFAPYPPFWATLLLATAIYVNFFAHHFVPDIRVGLFAATLILFSRTRIWYRIGANLYWMPLPLAAFLSAVFLWIAENIGTMTGTWVYSGQARLELVSIGKLGSWYLLLYVAFVTVTIVVRGPLSAAPLVRSDLATTEPPEEMPARSAG